jgi:hypothetical protein
MFNFMDFGNISGFGVDIHDTAPSGSPELGLSTPNLVPGTVVDISMPGLATEFNNGGVGVYCEGSFIGTCTELVPADQFGPAMWQALPLTGPQMDCMSSLHANLNTTTDTLEFLAPSCKLGVNGNEMYIVGLPGIVEDSFGNLSISADIKISTEPPSVSTPEPGSLMLLGVGLTGLWIGRKRALIQGSVQG